MTWPQPIVAGRPFTLGESFQSRFPEEAAPPDGAGIPYDDSAVIIPPVPVWLDVLSDYPESATLFRYRAEHQIQMVVDWPSIPPVHVSLGEANVVEEAAVLTSILPSVRVWTGVGLIWLPDEMSATVFADYSPQLDGFDLTSSVQTQTEPIFFDRVGVFYNNYILRTAADSIVIYLADSPTAAPFLGFFIQPEITTTHQFRTTANAQVTSVTTRNIRITYDAVTQEWGLRVPSGFTWGTFEP